MVSDPLPGFEGLKLPPRICGVCGEPRPTVRITSIVGETIDHPGVISHVNVCQSCLAESLEKLTGYRVKALLERWDKMNQRPKSILGVADTDG